MLLENITFSVSNSNAQEFETWIKSEIQNLGDWVEEVNSYKLMNEIDPESSNYSGQFIFSSNERFHIFRQLHYDLLISKAQKRFLGQILHFNTLLRRI